MRNKSSDAPRGFICVNAHPEGCRRNVERWVAGCEKHSMARPDEEVLVIGASTATSASPSQRVGYGRENVWACFSKAARRRQDASAGTTQTCRVHSLARNDRLFAASINGDAFSDEVKRNAGVLRKQMLRWIW